MLTVKEFGGAEILRAPIVIALVCAWNLREWQIPELALDFINILHSNTNVIRWDVKNKPFNNMLDLQV